MTRREKQVRDRMATLKAGMEAMLELAAKENRPFTEVEEADYQKLENELGAPAADGKPASGLFADLVREQKLAEIEKSLAVIPTRAAPLSESTGIEVKQSLTFKPTQRPKHFIGDTPSEASLAAYKAGQWLRAAVFGDKLAAQWTAEHGYGPQSLAQSSTTAGAGGVLVPDQLANTIINLREQYGVFRQNVSVFPMSTETMTIARRTSGLTSYFVSDVTATTASQAAFDGVGLTAKELACLVLYPRGLAEDAVISLADFLASEIALSFATKEDQCGFIGDGTSTYGGMTGAAVKINDGNYAGSIADALSGNVSFETLDLVDFHAVVAKLPMYARPNAKWYISSVGLELSMSRLAYASGGVTRMEVEGKMRDMFLGYPIVISQVLNSTAGSDVSKIKCLLGDLGMAAAMGDRSGFSIDTSAERYFEYRQIAIQGTERFDINVHSLGGSSSAGPLVALKTAAS